MLGILDENALVTVHGGKLPNPAQPFGPEKKQPTPAESQRKRDENLCARHWLSTMGLGEDSQAYRDGCTRMDQRQKNPFNFNGTLSPP